MPTVSDFIHSSFRLIGAIAARETLETDELNDALVSLNQMIATWNTEGTSLFARQELDIQVGPATNQYTLPQRPVKIEAAEVAISGINSPLEIVDSAGWSAITEQSALSVYIRKLYCDYQYPTAHVSIWPVPRVAGTLALIIYTPLGEFNNLTDAIDLPFGYEQALRYNFAIALLPEYPRSQADPSLPAQAQMYKASITQLNASNHARTPQPTLTTLAAQGTP